MTQKEIKNNYRLLRREIALLQKQLKVLRKKLEKLQQKCKHPAEEFSLWGSACPDCGSSHGFEA